MVKKNTEMEQALSVAVENFNRNKMKQKANNFKENFMIINFAILDVIAIVVLVFIVSVMVSI